MRPIRSLLAAAALVPVLSAPHDAQLPFSAGAGAAVPADLPPSHHASPPATADDPVRTLLRPHMQSYHSDRVWRVDWSSLDDERRAALYAELEEAGDIWKATPKHIDVRLSDDVVRLRPDLMPPDVPATMLIADLQNLVDLSFAVPQYRDAEGLPIPNDDGYAYIRSDFDDPPSDLPDGGWNVSTLATKFHDAFQPIDAMYRFCEALEEMFPEIVHGVEIGRSAEGRPIRAWKANIPVNGQTPDDEFIVISGQHAREWVGPASALYAFHSMLLDGSSRHKSLAAKVLRGYVVTIIPNINPDGYTYSREHSRMWRKNRQDVGGLLCKGIDLNTNWGYEFQPSRLACSESYSGQRPFEAPETAAVANYIVNGTNPDAAGRRERRVRTFVDLHSYGQLFMFPYSFSCSSFPPDAENLMEAGLVVAKAIRMIGGPAYQTGQACQSTQRYAGDASDFTYGNASVRWSYSAELRDTGTYGFMLPPFLIRPTGIDVTAGLASLAWFIYDTEIDP